MAKSFIIAETRILGQTMLDALDELGAQDFKFDAGTMDSERLTEFAGRLCYRSFAPGLNPNVTKIREGNQQYIANLLKQKHGSVLEHSTVSVLFTGVSRIFTHELVRHRPGMAYSQESQRYVRLDDFELYIPDLTDAFQEIAEATEQTPQWTQEKQRQFLQAVELFQNFGEEHIKRLIEEFMLDKPGVSFHAKKQITSALRRLLPGGVTTNILATGNHRMWRHILSNRTSPGAEQEIREVMYPLVVQLKDRYRNIYQDMIEVSSDNGVLLNPPVITFTNEGV